MPGLNVPRGKSLIVRSVVDVKTLGVDPCLLELVDVVDCELAILSLILSDELELSVPEWLLSEGVAGVFLPITTGDVRGDTALWLLAHRPPLGVFELLLDVTGVRTRFPEDEELLQSSGERVFSLVIVDSYGLKLDLSGVSLLKLLLMEEGGDVFSLVDSLLLDFVLSEFVNNFELGVSAPI